MKKLLKKLVAFFAESAQEGMFTAAECSHYPYIELP